MRKIIKGPGRQYDAVLSVSRKGYLHILLCKIPSQIVSIKLTRPQSKECQKRDWNVHRSISHGDFSSAEVSQDRGSTKMNQKALRKWAEFHTLIIVRRLGSRCGRLILRLIECCSTIWPVRPSSGLQRSSLPRSCASTSHFPSLHQIARGHLSLSVLGLLPETISQSFRIVCPSVRTSVVLFQCNFRPCGQSSRSHSPRLLLLMAVER